MSPGEDFVVILDRSDAHNISISVIVRFGTGPDRGGPQSLCDLRLSAKIKLEKRGPMILDLLKTNREAK
jgi:hypothetical protein